MRSLCALAKTLRVQLCWEGTYINFMWMCVHADRGVAGLCMGRCVVEVQGSFDGHGACAHCRLFRKFVKFQSVGVGSPYPFFLMIQDQGRSYVLLLLKGRHPGTLTPCQGKPPSDAVPLPNPSTVDQPKGA